jgi:hypothetical protein
MNLLLDNDIPWEKVEWFVHSRRGKPVKIRRGPATVNGEPGRMSLSKDGKTRPSEGPGDVAKQERVGNKIPRINLFSRHPPAAHHAMIHEPGDLPFPTTPLTYEDREVFDVPRVAIGVIGLCGSCRFCVHGWIGVPSNTSLTREVFLFCPHLKWRGCL